MKLFEDLIELQSTFTSIVQTAEYHCELKRLSMRFREAGSSELSNEEIMKKILNKSKKCGMSLLADKINEKEELSLDSLKQQMNQQQVLGNQLKEEIKKLQTTILNSSLIRMDNNSPKGQSAAAVASGKKSPFNRGQSASADSRKRTAAESLSSSKSPV